MERERPLPRSTSLTSSFETRPGRSTVTRLVEIAVEYLDTFERLALGNRRSVRQAVNLRSAPPPLIF